MKKEKVVVFLLVVFSVIKFSTVCGQYSLVSRDSSATKVPAIFWIDQIPSLKEKAKKKSFTRRLFQLFIGKKTPALIRPFSVYANDKKIWVLDQGKKTVLRIEEKVGKITQFFYDGSSGFPSLIDICGDDEGTVYFTDSKLNRLFYIRKKGKKARILNDSLQLNRPTGVAFSLKNKTIWVAETYAHCLTVLNTKGEVIRRIGQRGVLPGQFNFPTFIWIDNFGTIYVIDSMNFRVQIFDEDGNFISTFGKCGDAAGYFSHPKGIATDSRGNIYVADARFHAIQIFDKQGNFLDIFGNQGRGSGEFWLPSDIFIDKSDRIYVADSYNRRVQIFQIYTGYDK
ncbi:MAG: 6-bladed beta-propeller [Calditrichaeota bacterium]|nr:6-bladed beta-propeller [Calditrichota bacterium]